MITLSESIEQLGKKLWCNYCY